MKKGRIKIATHISLILAIRCITQIMFKKKKGKKKRKDKIATHTSPILTLGLGLRLQSGVRIKVKVIMRVMVRFPLSVYWRGMDG